VRRRGRLLFVLALALGPPAALALGAAFPATLRIPRRDPASAPAVPAAWFSHRAHGALGCYSCHPSVFPQAPLAFTHEDMRAGRYCGSCHDGARAFAITAVACGGCHGAVH
jgi:c(7)-type cytochrome triheme protein